ncbi:DUF1963 domain-containing protein [Deinococcus sp. YIM 134068]|uniref:DUF1963 domain-containing protein n=1 Tax=Deinococcus lichenicola TaxID=3118910 RepID=UPI002F930DF3
MTSLQTLIRHHGLTEQEDAILGAVRSAVLLCLGEPDPTPTPGTSRIGGLPDLPPSLEWPLSAGGEALVFLLQLDLRDVPHFAGNPLPQRGMLFLFLGLDEPASDVEHRLLLYTGAETVAPRPRPDALTINENYDGLPSHRIEMLLVPDLPRWYSTTYEALTGELSQEGQDRYEDLTRALHAGHGQGRTVVGQLFGHVTGIGHDAAEDAHIVRDVNPAWLYDSTKRATVDMTRAKTWRNLLRVNSVDELDLLFWDAGYLNVLIREADLEALNLTETYAAVETS